MLKHFVRSINKSYQWDFPKIVDLKCSTKESIRTLCSCHVKYACESESTLSSCLNVKEHLAGRRREIWSLSDCKWTQTHKTRQVWLRPVWLNGWVFVYERSGCGFESNFSHLSSPFRAPCTYLAISRDSAGIHYTGKLFQVFITFIRNTSAR